MNKGKIIGLSILAIFILVIGYIVYILNTPEFQVGDIINSPPKDYLEIFPPSIRKKLVIDYVLKPKYDNVICRYFYGNNLLIQEFAINSTVDKPLTEFIDIENKDDLNFTNTTTNEIRYEFFTVSYKNMFPKVSHLKVSLSGSPIKTIARNDTIAAFSSTINNFSIKYDGSDKSAIFCRLGVYNNSDTPVPSALPINIMFIKKQKIIYFLVMSIKSPNVNLKPDMLYNLVTNKK